MAANIFSWVWLVQQCSFVSNRVDETVSSRAGDHIAKKVTPDRGSSCVYCCEAAVTGLRFYGDVWLMGRVHPALIL